MAYIVVITIIGPILGVSVVYASFVIVFGSLAFNLYWFWRRGGTGEPNPPSTEEGSEYQDGATTKKTGPIKEIRSDSPAAIFNLMYGFVASFAITEAIRTFDLASSEFFKEAIKDPDIKAISLNSTSFEYLNFYSSNYIHKPEIFFNLIGFFSIAEYQIAASITNNTGFKAVKLMENLHCHSVF